MAKRKFQIVIILEIIVALGIIFPAYGESIIEIYTKELLEAQKSAIYLRAKSNLKQIWTCQEAYKVDHGRYINCPANPERIPSGKKLKWQKGPFFRAWEVIGFNLSGEVYYQYKVVNAGMNSFKAVACGDLDGDGIYSTFTIDQDGNFTESNPLE